MHLIIPKDYNPVLDLRDTEIAIKLVKDFFETELARALNLTRVSAPIMVTPESGLNDNLNGVERPVSFDILETGRQADGVVAGDFLKEELFDGGTCFLDADQMLEVEEGRVVAPSSLVVGVELGVPGGELVHEFKALAEVFRAFSEASAVVE